MRPSLTYMALWSTKKKQKRSSCSFFYTKHKEKLKTSRQFIRSLGSLVLVPYPIIQHEISLPVSPITTFLKWPSCPSTRLFLLRKF